MIQLRSYQQDAVDAIKKTFNHECRQYIEMPTGAGKTVTFLSYAKEFHKNILIIVPSRALLNQVYDSALKFYNPSQISRKGNQYNEKIANVHICIINSIRGDYLQFLSQRNFDLTIIDECHHVHALSYKRFIEMREKIFSKKDMKILGVTATPDRLDRKIIDELLHNKSFCISIESLIANKHLSDIEGFSVKTKISLDDIDSHNGDFSLAKLYNKINTESRNQLIVEIYNKHFKERKTLIFCVNIEHSKKITSLLQSQKISACHIDGKMSSKQQHAILESFHNDEISVLTNCQLLSEGFDEPSIDGIILARPTLSRSLFIQMIGRGLRIYPNKTNCKIVDIVDNHKMLKGFNNLIDDSSCYRNIDSFSGIQDIRNHINEEKIHVTEFTIERANFFEKPAIYETEALKCMYEYLEKNKINYYSPLTFDEASFLIWKDLFKKEVYAHG